MTDIARVEASTATYNEDTVPATLLLTPPTLNIAPDDTATPGFTFSADGGRVLTGLSPTLWEKVSGGAGLTLNTATGAITGVTLDAVITVRAFYAVGPVDLTSNTITVNCSEHEFEPSGQVPILFHDGSSVNMVDQWDEIWRGQATSTYVRGQFVIGTDPKKLKTLQTMEYKVSNVSATFPPTDNIPFSAAHEVAADCFGYVSIEVDLDGVITTVAPLTPQTFTGSLYGADMAYRNMNLTAPGVGRSRCAWVMIKAGPGGWVAGTDDLTFGGSQADYRDIADPDPYAIPRDFSGDVRIVPGAGVSFPGEATNVLELVISTLTDPGNGGGRLESVLSTVSFAPNTFAPSLIYITYLVKLSSGFMANADIAPGGGSGASGSLKHMIMHCPLTAGGTAFHFPSMSNSGAGAAATTRVAFGSSVPKMQAHDGITLTPPNTCNHQLPLAGDPNDQGDLLDRNAWHRITGVCTLNSLSGDEDGEIQFWIDGETVEPTEFGNNFVNGLHGTEIKFSGNGMRLERLEIDTTWGGGGPSIPTPEHRVLIGDLFISGGYARAGERPDRWAITASNTVLAGSFVPTTEYQIYSVGTTDFTVIGAASNAVGVVFTATGAGTGTGLAMATSLMGTATTIGQGDIVAVTAQLLDENDDYINLYGLIPENLILNGVTNTSWTQAIADSQASLAAIAVPAVQAEQGKYQMAVTAAPGATLASTITIGCEDWATILSGGLKVRGDHHASNTLSLTVTA